MMYESLRSPLELTMGEYAQRKIERNVGMNVMIEGNASDYLT